MAVVPLTYDADTDPDISDIAALSLADGDLLRYDTDGTRYSGVQPATLAVLATGSTTARTLAARFAEVANVKDYGALGDGSTNDSTAINAALASGAKSVFVPDGTYIIGSQLLMYLSDVTLYATGSVTFKIVDNIAVGITMMRIRGSRCTIRGIIFEGNNAAPAVSTDNTAINIDTNSGTITDLRFRDCVFQNFNSYGVFAFNAGTLTGLSFAGCKFRGFTNTDAIPPAAIQIVQPTTSIVRILDCQFEDLTGTGIGIRSVNNTADTYDVSIVGCTFNHDSFDYTSIGVEVLRAYGFTVSGCVFRNARMGLSFNGRLIQVSGNTFYNHTSYSIEASSSENLSITGNVIELFTYGVILYDGADNVVISSNTFTEAQATALSASNLGWAVQTSQTGISEDYNNIMVIGNMMYDCSGVRITRSDNVQISSNILETVSTDNQCIIWLDSSLCKSSNVSNNIIKTAVDRGNAANGYIVANGVRTRVSSNTITSTTGSANVGAGVSNQSAGVLTNCAFENNHIENFTNGFILSNGPPTASETVLFGNTFKTVTTPLTTVAGIAIKDKPTTDISDVGDADATLTARNRYINRWTVTLTANRTITLNTSDAYRGQTFRIVRIAGGAFNLDVGGLKTLAGAGEWCDVTYTGSAWALTAYGTL